MVSCESWIPHTPAIAFLCKAWPLIFKRWGSCVRRSLRVLLKRHGYRSRRPHKAHVSPLEDRIIFLSIYPAGTNDKLVLIDDEYPALLLTPKRWRTFLEFLEAIERTERVETLYKRDCQFITKKMDHLAARSSWHRRNQNSMIKVLEEWEAGDKAGECPYCWDTVDTLSEKMKDSEDTIHEWEEQLGRILAELGRERRMAIGRAIQLASELRQPFQGSGLLPSDKDSWLHERRSHGALLRHLYMRVNTEGFPFARKFHEREWRRADTGQEDQLSEHAAQFDEAINTVDIYRWNQRVAREDFIGLGDLAQDQKWHWHAEYRRSHGVAPSADQMDRFFLEEKARITRALVNAEEAYRQSVRALRDLGQSLNTIESKFMPSVRSCDSLPKGEEQYLLEHAPSKVQPWVDTLPGHLDAANTASTDSEHKISPDSACSSKLLPVKMMDSFSGCTAIMGNHEVHAKRKRADQHIVAKRDGLYFARRKRQCSDEVPPEDAGSPKHAGVVMPTERLFTGGKRRAEVPDQVNLYKLKRIFQEAPTALGTAESILESISTECIGSF